MLNLKRSPVLNTGIFGGIFRAIKVLTGFALSTLCSISAVGVDFFVNAIVNGQGHAIKTGKGSGGGYAIQRVYRYSAGKADIAPDYYHR